MLVKKPWFRKKIFGWGLSPATWQGWLVTIGLALVAALDIYFLPPGFWGRCIIFLALVIFISIVVFTGEKPGSRSE